MVGVISQFPQVGANFMGAYRDARQARLAEAAARAQMAAAQAERERQAQTRASFNRLVNPPAPVPVDTGVLGGLRVSPNQANPVEVSVPQYSPEQQREDMANVFMGGMGQDLAAYQSFVNPGAAEIPDRVFDYADTARLRYENALQSGASQQEAASAALSVMPSVARVWPNATPEDFLALVSGAEVSPQNISTRVIDTPEGQILVNARTGEEIRRFAGRPRRPGQTISVNLPGNGDIPGPGTRVRGAQLGEGFDPEAWYEPQYSASGRFLGYEPVQEGTPSPQRIRGAALGEGYDPEAFYQPVIQGGEVVGYEQVDEAADGPTPSAVISGMVRSDEVSAALDILRQNPGAAGAGRELLVNTPVVRDILSTTDTRVLEDRLETIRSLVGFDALQTMRLESPTGGALGPVSDFENRLLQTTMGNLRIGQRPAVLAYNLARLENFRHAVVHGIDFDGDGRVDPIYVEGDAAGNERRAQYAFENGPAGNPALIRDQIAERAAGASGRSIRGEGQGNRRYYNERGERIR